jgi:hypothetical protein
MTNFAVGAIFGFLACVWAIQTTPSTAFAALWQRLEEVQETTAAASQAYDAMRLGNRPEKQGEKSSYEKTDYR